MKARVFIISALLVLSVFTFLSFSVGTTSATTHYVSSSGSTYTTIQAAVDAASEGDTVIVGSGTYYESVTIATDGITIVGNNTDDCIISHHYVGTSIVDFAAAFNVTADNVNITGMNISVSGTYCMGIKLQQMYDGSHIYGNNITTSGANGFGIYANQHPNSNISCNNITTTDNNAIGINIYESDNTMVHNNTVATKGINGYGIYLDNVEKCNATLNTVLTLNADCIRGLMADNCNARNNWMRNDADTEDGIAWDTCTWGNLTGNSVLIVATGQSGIYVTNGNNNILDDNTINVSGDGNGIELNSAESITVTNNTITSWSTEEVSACIFISGTDHNLIKDNHLFEGSNDGGGIYISSSSENKVLDNTVVTRHSDSSPLMLNTADRAVVTGNTFTSLGDSSDGISVVSSDEVVFEDNIINTTGPGAEAFTTDTNVDHAVILNCTFTSSGTGSNGLFIACPTVAVHNTTISASNGYDLDLFNGGELDMVNCTFDVSSINYLGSSCVVSVSYIHSIHVDDTMSLNDEDDPGVPGAQVTIDDGLAATAFTGTTDVYGNIHWVHLTSFVWTDGSYDYTLQPYEFTATKAGYQDGVFMGWADPGNRTVNLFLNDTTVPKISGFTATPTTAINQNKTCTIAYTVNDVNFDSTMVFLMKSIGGNITDDHYRGVMQIGGSDITVTPAGGSQYDVDYVLTGRHPSAAYLFDTGSRDFVQAMDLTGFFPDLYGVLVHYTDTTYTNEAAMLLIYAGNDTMFRIKILDTDTDILPQDVAPTATIRPMSMFLGVDKTTYQITDAMNFVGFGSTYNPHTVQLQHTGIVPSGSYLLMGSAMDRGENFGAAYENITIDNSGPADIDVAISPLINGKTKGTITFTATTPSIDERDATFYFSADGSTWEHRHFDGTPASGFLYIYDSTQAPDFTGYVKVVMNDTWGNMNQSQPVALNIDNSPPSFTITDKGDFVKDLLLINASTTDNDISWCEFRYSPDNSAWQLLLNDTSGVDDWVAGIDTRTLDDGKAYFKVVMVDEVRHRTTVEFNVTIDNTAPQAFNETPTTDSWVAGGPKWFSVELNETNIDTVEFRFTADGFNITTIADTNGSDSWAVEFDHEAANMVWDDIYITTAVYVLDKAGNSLLSSWDARLDLVDPTIDILALDDQTLDENVTLELNFADQESGPEHILIYYTGPVNNTLYNGDAPVGFIESFLNVTELPEGNYTITAVVTDGVGNTGSDTLDITIDLLDPEPELEPDLERPTVVSTSPANATTNVSIETDISITFSEPMNTTTVDAVLLMYPWATTSPSWNDDNTTLTILIEGDLKYNTTYSIVVDWGAKDLAGNILIPIYQFEFTTELNLSINTSGGGDNNNTGGGGNNQTDGQDGPVDGETENNTPIIAALVMLILVVIAVIIGGIVLFMIMRGKKEKEEGDEKTTDEVDDDRAQFGIKQATFGDEDAVEVNLEDVEEKVVDAEEIFAEQERAELRKERELDSSDLDDLEDLDDLDDLDGEDDLEEDAGDMEDDLSDDELDDLDDLDDLDNLDF